MPSDSPEAGAAAAAFALRRAAGTLPADDFGAARGFAFAAVFAFFFFDFAPADDAGVDREVAVSFVAEAALERRRTGATGVSPSGSAAGADDFFRVATMLV